MPEFAEVEFFRKRWAQAATGQRIRAVQLHPVAKIFRGVNPATIAQQRPDVQQEFLTVTMLNIMLDYHTQHTVSHRLSNELSFILRTSILNLCSDYVTSILKHLVYIPRWWHQMNKFERKMTFQLIYHFGNNLDSRQLEARKNIFEILHEFGVFTRMARQTTILSRRWKRKEKKDSELKTKARI